MEPNGPNRLKDALADGPELRLDIYREACILMKRTPDGFSEYAVDPEVIGRLMAQRATLSTGLMGPNTLYVALVGDAKIVAEYRPAQITGMWLEGSEQPLRIPLPPMVMLRKVMLGQPRYMLYAVKQRPATLEEGLYEPPLPNIVGSNAICWGSVDKVGERGLAGIDLTEDWRYFLGSPFGGHGVERRSKAHQSDIRKLWTELEANRAKEWPLEDLVPVKLTLGSALKRFGGDDE